MKNKLILVFFALVAATILSGCATTGAAFVPVEDVPEGQALVYVYRVPSFTGSAISYDVKVDGEIIGKMKNGAYFYTTVAPGSYVISAKTESEYTLNADFEAGETYYIRGGITVGLLVGRPKLELVFPATGEKEITDCKMEE